jgi:NADPH:quinone reductase
VAGAHGVASVRSPELHAQVAALGADVVVQPDEVAAHGPYDVSLELVGAPGVTAVIPHLATGGRIVVIGVGAGAKVELNLLALMGSRAVIRGSTLRARSTDEKAAVASAVAGDVVPLLAEGRLRVPVAERFRMERAAEAYERFAAGGKFGKIVLVRD